MNRLKTVSKKIIVPKDMKKKLLRMGESKINILILKLDLKDFAFCSSEMRYAYGVKPELL